MNRRWLIFVFMFVFVGILFGACKTKRNPKYNPKKCKTCPAFGSKVKPSDTFLLNG